MVTQNTRQSLKLDAELTSLMDRLAHEHPYVFRHRLARLALRMGLRQLASIGPDGVRAVMATDARDRATVTGQL